MSKRALWFVVPVALFTACSSPRDDGSGPDGPLGALPDALTDSVAGPAQQDGSSTEVWSVTNQWTDMDTPAAKAKGIAWDANSGLTWEAKFGKWLASLDTIPNASGSGSTVAIVTPYGKTVPAPSLE